MRRWRIHLTSSKLSSKWGNKKWEGGESRTRSKKFKRQRTYDRPLKLQWPATKIWRAVQHSAEHRGSGGRDSEACLQSLAIANTARRTLVRNDIPQAFGVSYLVKFQLTAQICLQGTITSHIRELYVLPEDNSDARLVITISLHTGVIVSQRQPAWSRSRTGYPRTIPG